MTMAMARSDDQRVVVTGLGCVSGFGLGWRPFWSGLSEGRCAIRQTRRSFQDVVFDGPAATVPDDYDPAAHFPTEDRILLDPFAQFAVLAAREAMDDAGFAAGSLAPDRIGVVLGTGTAGEATREEGAIRLYSEKRKRGFPMIVPKLNPQASVGWVTRTLGATGPAFTLSTGCAAGTHAIGLGMMLLRQGMADCVVAGGSEAPVVLGTLKSFEVLRVIAHDTCRPFSRGRAGMVLAEGAGVVVLETLAGARRRGAAIHGEMLGFGMSADAADPVQPKVDGPARAMRLALADAGLAVEAVGHVNAHGTGTIANDRVETAAIRQAFGAHADRLAVSATKSMHGHSLGATGAQELVATVLALKHGLAPPTLNHLGTDPDCDLDCVVDGPRALRAEAAITNSFAFGGLNAVLAVGRAP